VSRQIRELEDELGVVIFERNGKRLTGLTEPGNPEDRRPPADRGGKPAAGQPRVQRPDERHAVGGGHAHAGALCAAEGGAELPRRLPDVRIALQQSAPEHIAEWVLSGKTDIGIATEGLSQFPTSCPSLATAGAI
jgi:LysR family cys regulon transcriptional activator